MWHVYFQTKHKQNEKLEDVTSHIKQIWGIWSFQLRIGVWEDKMERLVIRQTSHECRRKFHCPQEDFTLCVKNKSISKIHEESVLRVLFDWRLHHEIRVNKRSIYRFAPIIKTADRDDWLQKAIVRHGRKWIHHQNFRRLARAEDHSRDLQRPYRLIQRLAIWSWGGWPERRRSLWQLAWLAPKEYGQRDHGLEPGRLYRQLRHFQGRVWLACVEAPHLVHDLYARGSKSTDQENERITSG